MGDVFDGTFAQVWNTATGEVQTIPRWWLDDDKLGAGFSANPPQSAVEAAQESDTPNELWTATRMREYADSHGIELNGVGSKKADLFAAITTPITTTTTDTPADRGEE